MLGRKKAVHLNDFCFTRLPERPLISSERSRERMAIYSGFYFQLFRCRPPTSVPVAFKDAGQNSVKYAQPGNFSVVKQGKRRTRINQASSALCNSVKEKKLGKQELGSGERGGGGGVGERPSRSAERKAIRNSVKLGTWTGPTHRTMQISDEICKCRLGGPLARDRCVQIAGQRFSSRLLRNLHSSQTAPVDMKNPVNPSTSLAANCFVVFFCMLLLSVSSIKRRGLAEDPR